MVGLSKLASTAIRGITNWNVGVADHEIAEFTDLDSPNVRWFPAQEDRFLADPFPIVIDGQQYVFVEELPYDTWTGRISYIEYPQGFETGEIHVAYEEPFHMSYPQIFHHDGSVYAIPETYAANKVRLYEVHAPDDWRKETTLVDGVQGIDATVFEYEGRWWMFYTHREHANSRLYIRFADDLRGPWEPHAENPVKSDERSARPGGTPFYRDGELYRPAQYCVDEYGERIAVTHVTELTTTTFTETIINEIRPISGYPVGIHTLTTDGELTCVDGKRRIRNRHYLKRRFDQFTSVVL